jgi:KipI family sensor histidine kinase inhibitor
VSVAMRLLPCGDRALLVELEDSAAVLALHRTVRAAPPAGLVESVPAARTVLLVFDRAQTTAERLAAEVAELPVTASGEDDAARTVEIAVSYDGPDLAEVAERTGFAPDDVVARHCAPTYRVAFCGFAPGFAYLTGLDPELRLPRRSSPRTRVPAGSVAIAEGYTGVYPRPAPGGWHLVGRTETRLWALDRDPPALLSPGDRVRFVVR